MKVSPILQLKFDIVKFQGKKFEDHAHLYADITIRNNNRKIFKKCYKHSKLL